MVLGCFFSSEITSRLLELIHLDIALCGQCLCLCYKQYYVMEHTQVSTGTLTPRSSHRNCGLAARAPPPTPGGHPTNHPASGATCRVATRVVE